VTAGGDSAPCLGPGVGRVLASLAEAHAFDGLAPPGYRLERLDVKSDHLELGYDDADGPAATVLLETGPDRSSGSAGSTGVRGPHFAHRIVEEHGHAPEAARSAMLRAAMLVDSAMPADEVRRCGGPSISRDGASSMPPRAPAAFGIGAGVAEVLILVAALALGLKGPRRGHRVDRADPGA
jgi:hypothetical protein